MRDSHPLMRFCRMMGKRSRSLCLCHILFLLSGLFLYVWAGESPAKKSPRLIMYNGGPLHTGVYETKPLLHLRGLKWKFRAEGAISSPPLVYKDVVYFGDWQGNFYAVYVNTGKEKWRLGREKG